MKIGFINFSPLFYDADTPYKKPLGGSESAMCYLAESLVQLKHEVFLITHLKKKSFKRGVICFPSVDVPDEILESLDVVVVQNSPLPGYKVIKPLLSKKTKMVFWAGLDTNQPIVSSLSQQKVRDCYDGFAFVSKWQMESYISVFKMDPKKCQVIQNAIAPAFKNLFNNKKAMPPVLAYTSTPFRGLDILIKMFPSIRQAIPGVTLCIYSSMKVYQMTDQEEKKSYGKLYQLCQETEGVEYIGSIPQPKLAHELCCVSALVYPNIFAETSCIAIMEAMAAGCQIITSDLGALPETTAGFAKLIPVNKDYSQSFVNEVVNFLETFIKGDREVEKKLKKQVEYVRKHYTWARKAKEWEKWFKTP